MPGSFKEDILEKLHLKDSLAQITTGNAIFGVLVLCTFVMGTVCLVHAVSWINKPFASFVYYQFPGVGTFGDYSWPGLKAGVHYRDVILEVNGQRVFSGSDIHHVVKTTPVGDNLTYRFARQGETFKLDIPVSLFTLRDFFKTFVAPFLAGILFWVLGSIVYILKRDTHASWAFLLFCLSLGTYFGVGFEMQTSVSSSWSYVVNSLGFAMFPAACLHLSLVFPERTSLFHKRPWLPFLLYGISLILFASKIFHFVSIVNQEISPEESILISARMLDTINGNRLFAILAAIGICASSLHAYVHSPSIIAKQRSRIVLMGSGLAFIPATLAMSLVSLGLVVIPFNLFTPMPEWPSPHSDEPGVRPNSRPTL